MSNKSFNWFPLVIAFAIALGVLVGYVLQGRYNDQKPNLIGIGKTSKIDAVLGYIDSKYVERVDNSSLSENAIEEILKELDPHSYYFSVDEMTSVREEMSGNFEGIGIEFFIVDDTIMVVTPLSGGPSEALGILSGDKIVTIDDSIVAGIGVTNGDVIKKLKGPKGTMVAVGIQRFGENALIEYEIKRDKIPIFSVDVGYMVTDQVGYLKISRFNVNTYKEFRQKMEILEEKGISKLILDLRQNPGGYLDQATKILDEFIDGRKELVYTKGRQHPKYTYNAKRPGVFETQELVVLIDEGSASASEIIAGSIQDWDRGKIIGRRSFGKGLVQEQYQLDDGSALRLTVAKYYTPSGRCIQRPYETGNGEAYHKDYSERLSNGEFFSADSMEINDSLVYYTKIENRRVYGGGGITPDIFVPYDTLGYDGFFAKVSRKGLIQQFSYDYYASNKNKWDAYQNFDDYNTSFDIDNAMVLFKQFATSSGIKVPPTIDNETESNIENRLKAYMAKQHWNSEGFYPIIHDNDAVFQKALEEIM